jgi:hypothetical protein
MGSDGRERHRKPRAGAKRRGRELHRAAPFAVVRWTNIYDPAKLVFFGDIIGGPWPLYSVRPSSTLI